MLTLRAPVVVLLAIAFVCASVNARAQVGGTPAPVGTGAIFGAARARQAAPNQLDFSLVVAEGYDSDVPAGFRSTIDPTNVQLGGLFTTMDGAANYTWTGTRAQFGAVGNTSVRRYQELGETRAVSHSAGAGLSLQLPGKNRLSVNEAIAYSPSYIYDLFPKGTAVAPVEAPPPGLDYSVNNFASYFLASTFSLRHEFSRRSSIAVEGDLENYRIRLQPSLGWRNTMTNAVGGSYSYNLRRNTAFTARYRYRTGDTAYATLGKTTEQGITLGLDVTRPLSVTRRASFGFRLGVSSADVPDTVQDLAMVRRQYLLNAETNVSYQFSRSWQMRANYKRGLEYVVDFPDPVFADGYSAQVDGLITRRVDITATAGYSSGASLLNRNTFDTYIGSVRARWALSSMLAVYLEYLSYYYDFRHDVLSTEDLGRGLSRNGVRAGVTLWAPALRR